MTGRFVFHRGIRSLWCLDQSKKLTFSGSEPSIELPTDLETLFGLFPDVLETFQMLMTKRPNCRMGLP